MTFEKENVPIYLQIFDILKKKIANNEYPVGEFMPTEMDLMKDFGVSRVTIRKSLEKLARQGYIAKKAGYGTVVLKRENVSNFTMVRSSFSKMTEMSSMYKTLELKVEQIEPTIEQRELFHMHDSDKLWKISRIRGNNKRIPVVLSYIYLKFNHDFSENDLDGGLYSFLESHDVFFTNYHEHLTAIIGQREELLQLRMNGQNALLKRSRFSYANDELIEYTINYYNPKYYEYRADFVVNGKKNKK